MAILGNWVNRTGVRHTTPGTVHELCVKVDAHAGIDRVEFAIVANGTPHSTLTASTPSIRKPNFSAVDSPLPGVPSGMAPFTGWGVGLDLSTVPAGTLVVTATVFDTDTNSLVLPETITVYNDTDGTDRRPRAVTLYADGDAGNDANDGTSWAQAVRTIMRARQLGRSGAGDVSGLRIICRGTFVDLAGGIFPECTTSGDWHCEHIADAAGAYLNPPGDPSPIGARTVYGGATGASSATVTCRTRWTGFRINGTGIVSYSFGGICEHWFEGCYSQGTNWSEGRLSVRYAEPAVGGSGSVIGWNGPGPAGRRYFTGCTIRGAVLGFEQSRLTYDCLVRDFTGIACKVGSAASPSVVGALLMQSERYYPREVEGFVRMDSDPVQGQGRPALTVTKPTSSTARITGPVGGYDFSIDAAELVGTTYWGLRFEGSGATGLDTGVGLLVTAVGNAGGAPWVEVTAPGASAGSISANTCSFYTARVATGMNYWNIHPDGIQIERALVQGDAIFDCAIVDAPNLQSYFTSGNDIDKALLDNLRDDGSGENAGNWNGTDCTDSILQRLTLRGQFQNSGGGAGWAGTYVRNCVFGSLGGDASSIGSRGGTVTNCHVISGGAFGTSGTTGSWFEGDESADPWPFAPATANRGTGSAAVSDPAAWAYSGSGSTRGVLRNVGDLDWSIEEPGTTVVHPGPGDTSYQSSRFAITINGEPGFVWAYSRTAQYASRYWTQGVSYEISWACWTGDETVEVVIARTSGSISSAVVYPKDKGVTQSIVSGNLVLQVPPNVRLFVELDDDGAEPICLFCGPVQAPVPDGAVDWTAVGRFEVSAIDAGTNVITCPGHEFVNGQRVGVHSTGTYPTASGGDLAEWVHYYAANVSGSTLQLERTVGGGVIDLTGAGSGTITIYRTTWPSTTPLRFPAGMHTIGHLFDLATGYSIYCEPGAVLRGNLDVRGATSGTMRGWAQVDHRLGRTNETLKAAFPSFFDQILYCGIVGYDGSNFTYDTECNGLTFFGGPFYLIFEGIGTFRNTHYIQPLGGNSDGFMVSRRSSGTSRADDCFAYGSDDLTKQQANWFASTMTNMFLVNGAHGNAADFGYSSSTLGAYQKRLIDSDAYSQALNEESAGWVPGGRATLKAWVDATLANSDRGYSHIYVDDLKVWGPATSRLFSIQNIPDPNAPETGVSFDGAGQLVDITIRNVWSEESFTSPSRLFGRDAANAPHQIALENIVTGGVVWTAANWTSNVVQNEWPYDVTINGVRVDRILTTGAANVPVGASGTSGLLLVSVGSATVSISAAGAAALQVGAVGTATIPIAASGFSTLGVVVPVVPPAPTNAPRGAGVAPSMRLRRGRWWTWLSPW